MSNEEKIKDLEARLVKLEKVEKRRKIGVIINVCAYALLLIFVIVACVKIYLFVKPIKEAVDNFKSLGTSKIDEIKDGFGNFDLSDFSSWFY